MGAVLEDAVRGSRVGQIGRDIARGDLKRAIEHVLRVHEHDFVDELEFAQHDGACQAIEVCAGDESMLGCCHRGMEGGRCSQRGWPPSLVRPGARYSSAR